MPPSRPAARPTPAQRRLLGYAARGCPVLEWGDDTHGPHEAPRYHARVLDAGHEREVVVSPASVSVCAERGWLHHEPGYGGECWTYRITDDGRRVLEQEAHRADG